MNTSTAIDLHQMALDCVAQMGDIFWDYNKQRDTAGGYRDPRDMATQAIERALCCAITENKEEVSSVLRLEYETLLSELPQNPTDDEIINTLSVNADWTPSGARELLRVARDYGTSILRNAVALALAMGIEDGEKGL